MTYRITRRIRVYGIVQGVGFRPTVSRHAAEAGITGTVCNYGPYVEIIAQGSENAVSSFLHALEHRPPKRAAILKTDIKTLPSSRVYPDFSIIESGKTRGEIFVSPDIAVCDDCKREMYDPRDRRYLHPFINCTSCGPRMTILDELPYDRERTSMKKFPMCPECEAEYHSPATRRFDAQPVCCNYCGPEVSILGTDLTGRPAITAARKTIRNGGIVAVKGIGGFHLCCNAEDEDAVRLLRKRKHRPVKPLAVMMRDYETVLRECNVLEGQEEILTGHQKPILLLENRPRGKLCPSIAPGNPSVGVMLPYAPIHLLLFDYNDGLVMPDCLVMTSGNPSGAPICRDDAGALASLGGLCDCILTHNRDIRIRADDSVMDYWEGKPYMIRRSRGYAPLPYMLSGNWKGNVLAVGGELKNSCCLASDGLLYLSPYIGDLGDLRTAEALKETIRRFSTLLEINPSVVACDLHPGYHSVRIAQETGLPVIRVQHHYAHILSCMVENDRSDPVIGVSFDGTGYGTDGSIWGGEILLARTDGFARLGSIVPFLQPGGDASAREGWRIAVSMLYALTKDRPQTISVAEQLALGDPVSVNLICAMCDQNINTVRSTSAGRLFDAVSALLGICRESTFEGDASTALQYHAQQWLAEHPDETVLAEAEPCVSDDGFLVLPTDSLVRDLLERRLAGEDADALAYQFHIRLASQIVTSVTMAVEQTGITTAALSGGCYQNRLLLDLTAKGLRRNNIKVLTHSLVPPNDGGIALGQAMAALYRLSSEETPAAGTGPAAY